MTGGMEARDADQGGPGPHPDISQLREALNRVCDS